MRKLLLLTPLLALWLASCDHEEKPVTDKKIQFSFTDASLQSGGRIAATGDPQSVMVTVQDEEGTLVAERMELTLYKFGDDFLSIPLTLKASGASVYQLTEFFVIGSDNQVTHVTPKEGSSLAHLVADPLDIEFKVEVDKITTVTPEVITVDATANAADYGYGQFGFKVINTISAVFSAFIKSESNFELTDAHIKIEGLDDNANDPQTLWVYETDLLAKASTLSLKEAQAYRITASKSGYRPWNTITPLEPGAEIEILFEEIVKTVDVYVAGSEGSIAKYWKNGIAVTLSTITPSHAYEIVVSESGDVYVTGDEQGTSKAFYWKNGEKILLPEDGSVSNIYLSGNDVYAIGSYKTITGRIPVYWKNGIKVELPTTTTYPKGHARTMVIDGPNVYVAGKIAHNKSGVDTEAPALWKNAELTILPSPTFTTVSSFSYYIFTLKDLRISNGHLYVGGYAQYQNNEAPQTYAVYWKDGNIVQLNPSGTTAYALGLEVAGDDVYVVGFQAGGGFFWQGKYWKNGEEVIISSGANVNLYGISLAGSNVYVAGDYKARGERFSTASYWVNGERVQCGTGSQSSFAFGMCTVTL